MNDNGLFLRNERLILQMANSPAFREYSGIREIYPIVKVTPNSLHFLADRKEDKPICLARFYCNQEISRIFLPVLSQLEITSEEYGAVRQDPLRAGLHFAGIQRNSRIFPTLYLKVTDFNTTGGDGEAGCGGDPSFSNMHNATNGSWVNTAANNVAQSNFGVDHTDKYWIKRPFVPFDTSSIGGGKITAGVLYLYVNGSSHQWGGGGCFAVVVGPTTQATLTNLVTDDYDQCGSVNNPTEGSNELALSYISSNQNRYHNWTLTTTGLGWINGKGYTKLGLRCGIDFTASDPGMGGNQGENFVWNTSYSSSNKPYLEVTYTPAGGGAFNFLIF